MLHHGLIQEEIRKLFLSPLSLEKLYIKSSYPNLYRAAIRLYGSWAAALRAVGITTQKKSIRKRFWIYILKKYKENVCLTEKTTKEWMFELHEYLLIGGNKEIDIVELREGLLNCYGSIEQVWNEYEKCFGMPCVEWYEDRRSMWDVMNKLDQEMFYIFEEEA